jgi:hypothetical protein
MQREAERKIILFFLLSKGKEGANKNQTKKKKKYFCVFIFIRKTQRRTNETKRQKTKTLFPISTQ